MAASYFSEECCGWKVAHFRQLCIHRISFELLLHWFYGNQSQLIHKQVPWSSWDQWKFVRDNLFSLSPESVSKAIEKISAWRSRGCLPRPIDVTSAFIEIQQKDPYFRGDSPSETLQSEELLTMLYCMAIMRLVNCFVEPRHKKTGKSISQLAEEFGIPRMLVDIRHESSHRDLPSLRLVRNGAIEALDWLKANYWEPQQIKIPDVRKEVRLKLHELSICLKKSDSLQKEKQGFKRSGPLVRCTKLSSQMVGKLRMSKSDVSSKRVAKITNIIARLYSSYPSEVVAVLLEFFKLQAPNFSNDDEMEGSDDSDQDSCMDELCDVKTIISRLSRKKPGLILSILKTLLEMIKEWEYAQSKTDEIQTRTSGINNLCSLVFWLLKNIKALKKLNKIRILDEPQSVLSTDINASPHVSLTKLLHKILSLSVIRNKHLLKSASLLIKMIDDTALARKIMKIPLPRTEEQSNVNSASPIEYNIEESSIKEEMEKLESLKLNIRKRKCESVDSGNGKLWNLAKSWIPCPLGMLPCSFSSTAVLPVMDRIEEASEDGSVQVKNTETGMCTSDACEKESVSKKLKVVEESEADTLMDMSGSMEGRLLIAGIWEKINEEELSNMETNIKIFVRF